MRGEDERSGTLFSYVDLEARVGQDHLLRTIRAIVNEALAALAGVLDAVLADGTAVDPAREALASDALASVRLDPLGAAVDGSARVRPLVSPFRRHWRRRCGVGSLGVFQEPRAPVGRRHRRQVVERGFGAAAGEAVA